MSDIIWTIKRISESEKIVLRSLKFDQQNEKAQFLLRETRSSKAYDSASYMRILLHGFWPESSHENPAVGFFITYDVVADSKEEALGFIREVMEEAVSSTLTIENVDFLEVSPQPKGIYKVTDHYAYPVEKSSSNA